MRYEILLAAALVVSIIGDILSLFLVMKPVTVPLPGLGGDAGHERYLLSRRAVRARQTARAVWCVVIGSHLVLAALLRYAGADRLQAGLGPLGPWVICLAVVLPIGLYLASENDARESREGKTMSATASDPNLGFQYQRALAIALDPQRSKPRS